MHHVDPLKLIFDAVMDQKPRGIKGEVKAKLEKGARHPRYSLERLSFFGLVLTCLDRLLCGVDR